MLHRTINSLVKDETNKDFCANVGFVNQTASPALLFAQVNDIGLFIFELTHFQFHTLFSVGKG